MTSIPTVCWCLVPFLFFQHRKVHIRTGKPVLALVRLETMPAGRVDLANLFMLKSAQEVPVVSPYLKVGRFQSTAKVLATCSFYYQGIMVECIDDGYYRKKRRA